MNTSRRTFLTSAVLLAAVAELRGQPADTSDPLPSWNAGTVKQAILEFVAKTTTKGGKEFLEPAERIAVFDNDGCLWSENPLPFQLAFALDSLRKGVEKNPTLKEDPAVRAALAGDSAALLADNHKGLFRILALTHAGMTTDEFDARVEEIRAAQEAKARDLTEQAEAAQARFFERAAPILLGIVRDRGAAVLMDSRAVLLSAERVDITGKAAE